MAFWAARGSSWFASSRRRAFLVGLGGEKHWQENSCLSLHIGLFWANLFWFRDPRLAHMALVTIIKQCCYPCSEWLSERFLSCFCNYPKSALNLHTIAWKSLPNRITLNLPIYDIFKAPRRELGTPEAWDEG